MISKYSVLTYIQTSLFIPQNLQYITDKFIYKNLFLIYKYSMSSRINIYTYRFVSYIKYEIQIFIHKK